MASTLLDRPLDEQRLTFSRLDMSSAVLTSTVVQSDSLGHC